MATLTPLVGVSPQSQASSSSVLQPLSHGMSTNPGYVAPKAVTVKSPSPTQSAGNIGSTIMNDVGAVGGAIVNAVKGIFTPTGGKPQPIKSAPTSAPSTPVLTQQQKASIATLKPGQVIPNYQPPPQIASPTGTTKKKTPVQPNAIDTFFGTVASVVGKAIQPIENAPITKKIENSPITKQVVQGVTELMHGIVPNENQVAPRQEYMSQQEYNTAVKNATHPTIGAKVNQFLGQQVAMAPAMLVGGYAIDPVTESLAKLVPDGTKILTNILSLAAKGAIKSAPYGTIQGALTPAKDATQRLTNTAEDTAVAATIGLGIGAAEGLGSELVQKFGQSAESFLANRTLIQKVVNGNATSEELKQFNILNDTGLTTEAARSPEGISVTTQTQKQGKMWDILRYIFSKPATGGTGKPAAEESQTAANGTMEFTPKQAQAVVVGSDLENTPVGKEILKTSIQAQKANANIEVAVGGTGESNLKTPGGIPITSVDLVQPSSASLNAAAGKPIEGENRPVVNNGGRENISPSTTSLPHQNGENGEAIEANNEKTSTTQQSRGVGQLSTISEEKSLLKTYMNPTLNDTQKDSQNYLLNNIPTATKNYTALVTKEFGTPNVIAGDVAKNVIPGHTPTQSDNYHEAASSFVKYLYDKKLAANKGQGNNTVMFLSGGTGAGKTSSLRSTTGEGIKDYPIVYDTNLDSVKSATSKIQKALDNGYKVNIVYAQRDPVTAFEKGVIPRTRKEGRTVPLDQHMKTHMNALPTLEKLKEKFGDQIEVHYIDNTGERGTSHFSTLENLPKFSYTKEELEGKLNDKLDEARQQNETDSTKGLTADEVQTIRTPSASSQLDARQSPSEQLTPEETQEQARTLGIPEMVIRRTAEQIKELGRPVIGKSDLQTILRNSPDFKANPVLTVSDDKQLTFHGTKIHFNIRPEAMRIDPDNLQPGDKILVDTNSLKGPGQQLELTTRKQIVDEARQQLESAKTTDDPRDPVNQLLTIADKVGQDPVIISADANKALTMLAGSRDFTDFTNTIETLADQFDGSFTEVYNKIQSGEITQDDYGTYREAQSNQTGETSQEPLRTQSGEGGLQATEGNTPENTGSQEYIGENTGGPESSQLENNTPGRGSLDQQRTNEGESESINSGAEHGISTSSEGSQSVNGSGNAESGSGLTSVFQKLDAYHQQPNGGIAKALPISSLTSQEIASLNTYLFSLNDKENDLLRGAIVKGYAGRKDLVFGVIPDTGISQWGGEQYLVMGLDKNSALSGQFRLHGTYIDPKDIVGRINIKNYLQKESKGRVGLKNTVGEPEGNNSRPSSTTLRAEVVPGLSKFFEEDIIPSVTAAKEALQQTTDVINPPRANEKANRSSNIVREALAKIENYESLVHGKYQNYRKFFSKYSDEQNIRNISEYERSGQFSAEPVSKPGDPSYSKLYHDSMVDSYKTIQAAYGRDTDGFIENYVRRAFVFANSEEELKGIDALTNFQRSLSGNKSPLKQRVLNMPLDEAFKDMTDRGIKVKMQTTNPEELRQWSLVNAKRLVVYKGAWNDLKTSGLIKFVRRGGERPAGMVPLQDRAAEVFAPAEVHFGMPPDVSEKGYQTMLGVGKYYADPSIARIMNNVISSGLENIKLFKAARLLGNQMNSFQLGLSAFHLTGSAINAGFSDVALGFRNYIQGKPIEGTNKIIRGLIPGVSFARDLYHGQQFMKNLMKDDPETMALVEKYINPAGGRLVRDKKYNDAMGDKVKQSLANGNFIGAALKLPSAIVEGVAHPLLNYAIPRVKIGAFMDLATNRMQRLPADASRDQVQSALAGAWNSIDNRFGQLVYSNLFWNKVGKDLAMLTTRSVGWNLGDARELGGGILKDPIRTMLGGKDRVANNFGERFSDRMLFATALILGTSVLGAIYQYLHTGQGPSELKDYFFPKDGGVDTAGNPTRRSLPTYWKDVYAFSTNPLGTIGDKVSPGLETLLNLWNDKDYYGNLIVNPNDPIGMQLEQAGSYFLQNIMPFSIQSANQPSQNLEQKIEGFLGIVKAPASIIESANQKAAITAYQNQVGLPGPKTPEQQATQALKTKAYAEIKQGMGTNSPAYKQLVQNGTLNTARKQKEFIENAKLTSLQRMGKSLPVAERNKLNINTSKAATKGTRSAHPINRRPPSIQGNAGTPNATLADANIKGDNGASIFSSDSNMQVGKVGGKQVQPIVRGTTLNMKSNPNVRPSTMQTLTPKQTQLRINEANQAAHRKGAKPLKIPNFSNEAVDLT